MNSPNSFNEGGFGRIASMTSPRGKDPHAAVLVAEPVRTPLQRIPGRSHAKRVFPFGRALSPVRVALLAPVYWGASKLGLTMAIGGTVGGYRCRTRSLLDAVRSARTGISGIQRDDDRRRRP